MIENRMNVYARVSPADQGKREKRERERMHTRGGLDREEGRLYSGNLASHDGTSIVRA